MAVIGKLRDKMGILLVVFIGFALFAFILGELLTSQNSFLFGGNKTDNSLAVIAGEKVSPEEFGARVKEAEENYKEQSKQPELDQNAQDMVRENVWNEFLREKVYRQQLDKLGLTVSDAELADMCYGNNIDPEVKRAFTDPQTGAFDKATIINYIKNLDNLPNDPDKKAKKQWVNYEDQLVKNRTTEKYNDLIKGGMFVTTEEVKADFYDKGRTMDARVVKLMYNSIVDSTIAVTDAELNEYYNSHQYKYKAPEATRGIRFVTFDVMPSADDRKAVIDDINKLFTQFQTSTNDSLLAAINSDEPYNDAYRTKGSFTPALDSVVFSRPIGTIIGPFEENGSLKLAKITGTKSMYDSVQVRHILLKIDNPADSAKVKARADSVINVIKGGMDFGILAMQLSDDPGSKEKMGDLGYVTPEVNFVPEFKEAVFNGKLREIQLVKSQFGYHITQITDQKNLSNRVKVAEIVRNILPSNKTNEMVFQRANAFAGSNQTLEEFEAACKKENLPMRPADNIKINDKNIGGLGPAARELVTWAFNPETKKGNVSRPTKIESRYVVAALAAIADKGIMPLENVKPQVEAEVRKDKKALQLIEKMKGAANIDALAQKLGVPADTVRGASFGSPYLPGIGMEPTLSGSIPALKANQVSAPIKGQNGVYVMMPFQVNEPAATPADFKPNKMQMMQMLGQRAFESFNALKEKANVVDNRVKYY